MSKHSVNITILDKYDPETMAMIQAMYSRSHLPIGDRLDELGNDPTSVKEALKKYYIGYGHKSIGQCGATTLFIEGVSFLCDKAIQDSRLYNGQETSTRYIDFTSQYIHDPLNDTTGIQQKWLDFYVNNSNVVLQHVAQLCALNLDNEVEYKTAKARAFDILRAFLPAGCSTQLSWFTTFTHASDRLMQLCYHPLKEVREVSRAMAANLQVEYPYAFDNYDKQILKYADYYSSNSLPLNYFVADERELRNWPEFECKQNFSNSARTTMGLSRTKGVPVPRHLQYNGRFQCKYLLDYGSFRDIQRHRDCVQMQSILTTDYGFGEWYIDALPNALKIAARKLIFDQTMAINKMRIKESDVNVQYYVPLGFKLPCIIDMDYPQLVYISELRSSTTVHPTLRVIAKKMAKIARDQYLVNMFDDDSEDVINLKRGLQDIVKI